MGYTPAEPLVVVELGATPIGDVYCHSERPVAGRRPLVGYFDLCDATAYVIEHEVEGLGHLIGAERHGGYIRVARGRGYVEYAVRDLGHLDFDQPIEVCDMAGLYDRECQFLTGCIPVVNRGVPLGSFRAPPEGVSGCYTVAGSRCVEIWRRLTVSLYANQDCTPEPPTPTTLIFALCSIG